jgi:hypothetical protein
MKTIQTEKYEIIIKSRQNNKPAPVGRDGPMGKQTPSAPPAGTGR